MSMLGGPQVSGNTEVGEMVASFPEYEAAQKAVSKLIAAEIAARDIAIVGSGLRSIERVTGKLGYATAARSGAINGVLIGLFFAAILVLGSPAVPIQAFVGVLFVGIAVGMLLSLVTYSFVRRRRDYASVVQVTADHYEVTVASRSIHRAREILGRTTVVDSSTVAAVDPMPPVRQQPVAQPERSASPRDGETEPPRYGERVAPAPDPAGGEASASGNARADDAGDGAPSRNR
ncbi:general stress protein [Microbacterium sp. DT81.1]|uniref:general stress protein n=1 Tax=Microbacterium sp. DT81.1 TaxID=3393413 RepID=UPI003CF62658